MKTAPPMLRAYSYPSGLIVFERRCPGPGARVIAQGRAPELREFIAGKARRVTLCVRRGRREACRLYVPGMNEAGCDGAARQALSRWTRFIAAGAPEGIRVTLP